MRSLKKTLSRFHTAGTQHLPDNSFPKKISLSVNQLSLRIGTINSTIGIAGSLIAHSPQVLLGVITETVLLFLPIYLNHRRLYKQAALVQYLVLSAATFFFGCSLDGIVDINWMIVVLIGAARFIFIDRRTQLFGYLVALFVLLAGQINKKLLLIHPIQVDHRVGNILFWSAYVVLVILIINIFDWYGQSNESIRLLAEKENMEKDRFIANATHEIKAAFRSVFAIISVLKKSKKPVAHQGFEDIVEDLEAACKNTSGIIDNIFEYERYKAGGKPILRQQLVDIRATIQNIIDIYRHLASEKKVTLELTICDSVPYHIVCDEMKLWQIVTNLVHNAIKFTNNDTTVQIEVSLFESQLVISVRDHGDGIAGYIKERMFEPFVTQNPNGLGLGLYIVQELVTAFNGSVEAVNNRTGGATVTVTWPLPGPEAYRLAVWTQENKY